MNNKILCLAISITAMSTCGTAQSQHSQDIDITIRRLDSLFWAAYNACDVEKMQTFFTDDLEFYHDKGGLTTSLASLIEVTKKNLCSNKDWRLRREVVPGSLQVFPLNNYGAILSGEHVFFVNEAGQKERLDGHAKFTHVWRYKDNEWKMHRILSFDHRPADSDILKKEITLSVEALKAYSGKYESLKYGVVTIAMVDNALTMDAGNFQIRLYAEKENLFFTKGRGLKFEFVRNADQKVLKMIVHENGNPVDEAKRLP